jgi:hypothetical protein
MRNNVFIIKPPWKRTTGRKRHKKEENIKMIPRKNSCKHVKILKWHLEKMAVNMWSGLNWFGIGFICGVCEHSDESCNRRKFLGLWKFSALYIIVSSSVSIPCLYIGHKQININEYDYHLIVNFLHILHTKANTYINNHLICHYVHKYSNSVLRQ